MGKIVMGYWDCQFCDNKHIAGSLRDCPSCGHPRPDGTKFYMDGTKAVDKQTEQRVRKRGKDWVCKFCDCLNSGEDKVCISCGSPRYSDTDTTQNEQSKNDKEVRRYYSESQQAHENYGKQKLEDKQERLRQEPLIAREADETVAATGSMKIKYFFEAHKRKILIAFISLLLVAASIFGLVWLLTPEKVEFTVTELSWKYDIDIERYTTVNESDWSIPPGGRLQYTQQEIHHYDEVIDHYEPKSREVIDYYDERVVGYRDLGNGYFEEITERFPVYKTEYYSEPIYRRDPVYATKYYYEIERWLYYRTVTTSAPDKNPYWGKTNLATDERESKKHETYYITGVDSNGKTSTYVMVYNEWISCELEQYLKGTVNRITNHFTPEKEK